MSSATGPVIFEWRGAFTNTEVNRLHAEAFETRLFSDEEWNWRELTARHSLGWITARDDGQLVGFANVLWDGLVHAWIQDVMVATSARRQRIGVRRATEQPGPVATFCTWISRNICSSSTSTRAGSARPAAG